MWLQLREFNSLRSPHSNIDSPTPCHWPLAPWAARGTPVRGPSERGGSRFEAWAASQLFLRVSFKGKDRTLRTFRLGFDSSYPYQIFRPVVQFARDAALRTLKLGLESPLVDHARCRPTGEALDCRSRRYGFDSRTPRQVFLRGCRLIGKDGWLSISGCGIVTRRPYQISGL